MKPRINVSRRAFLGGAGVLLALPALDSLIGRGAAADDTVARRLLTFYVPNGINMAKWTPALTGANYKLSPILVSLTKLQKKLLVLTNLDNQPAHPDGPGDHAGGTAGFLTCRHVVKTEGAGIKNGISMDQVAAATLKESTRIASLQLGMDGGSSVGDCDSGYSCAYARNISWASETQPLPKTVSPQVVFDLLFDGFDPEATAADKARRLKYRTSILDYTLADAKRLHPKLGVSDQHKLDEYMTGVSELEKRLQKTNVGAACTTIPRPPEGLDYPEQVKLMLDLMVLAFQCDATRVISFMLGNAGSGRSYEFLGVTGGHHEISHHQGLQENLDKLEKIDTWEVEQYAYLLDKMDSVVESNGATLLDNSAVYFSSELEDGNAHRHTNLPVLLAGSCGGSWKTGQHIAYPDGPPLANLFITMLGGLGAPVSTFGDEGTGPLKLA
jgi:Protein of unknown function (DUF1552)